MSVSQPDNAFSEYRFSAGSVTEWRGLLLGDGGTLLRKPLMAGYDSDLADGGRDMLSIDPDVEAFARLIALKQTRLPLSIALFGAWGSGKTFFMRRLQDKVRGVVREEGRRARSESPRQTPFVEHVLQIEFNAWTYSDANLLASLAVEIFERLLEFTAGERRADKQDRIRNEALIARLQTTQAEEERRKAEIAALERLRDTAQQEKSEAEGKVERALQALNEMQTRDVWGVIGDLEPQLKQPFDAALRAIGVQESATTARDAMALYRRLFSAGGRFGLLARRLSAGGRPALSLFAIVAVIVLGVPLLPQMFPGLAQWFDTMATQLTAGCGALLVWGNRVMSGLEGHLAEVEGIAAAIEKRRQTEAAGIKAAVEEKQAQIDQLRQELLQKQGRLEEAQNDVQAAEDALAAEAPHARLARFITDRADSKDYRKHLGVVRLLKDDFDELSRLMDLQAKEETRDPKLPQIDRIVLYIDDLDRCRPATVKAVLEAVHLLLSGELFVVVVGVDEKWVSSALTNQYRGLLSESHAAPPAARTGDGSVIDAPQSEVPRPATSADFIEKIFQVPFWLRPMDDRDVAGFLDGLLQGQLDTQIVSTLPPPGEGQGLENGTPGGGPADVTPLPPAVALASPSPVREPVPALKAVLFSRDEIQFMKRLGPLVGRTPRATKRYVNIYRLIRARLQGPELRNLLGLAANGEAEFPLVQLLLALETSQPAVAAKVEKFLRDNGQAFIDELLSAMTFDPQNNLSPRVKRDIVSGFGAFKQACPHMADVTRFAAWAPLVARYSFRRSAGMV